MAARDLFIADSYCLGLGIVASPHCFTAMERHARHCRAGMWRISLAVPLDILQLLDFPRPYWHAVVDDFGTLQVVPA